MLAYAWPGLNARPPEQRFACVGCGACCRGRFVPLTLSEARAWLRRGHRVAVMLEAFDETLWPPGAPQYPYNLQRSAPVQCGSATVQVTAILAANALPECPNLQSDGLCSIYTERPLVCRIYPQEISPFIPLQASSKDCPPDSWEQGELIASDYALAANVQQSRQADREDADAKVALCEALGLTTAAWKSNGLAIYQPPVTDLLQAIESLGSQLASRLPWRIQARDTELRTYLHSQSLALDEREQLDYIFHPLQG